MFSWQEISSGTKNPLHETCAAETRLSRSVIDRPKEDGLQSPTNNAGAGAPPVKGAHCPKLGGHDSYRQGCKVPFKGCPKCQGSKVYPVVSSKFYESAETAWNLKVSFAVVFGAKVYHVSSKVVLLQHAPAIVWQGDVFIKLNLLSYQDTQCQLSVRATYCH